MIFLSDCYRLYISCKINKGKALNYQTDLSNWYQVYISCKNETIKGGPGSLLFFVHSPCSQCSRFVRKKGIFSGTGKALNYQTDLSNWYQVYISCKNETIKGGPGSLLFFVHSPCSQCSRFVRKKGIFSGTAKKKLSKTYFFPGFFRFLPSKTQGFFPGFFHFWPVNY